MYVKVYAHFRHAPNELCIIEAECAELTDIVMNDQFVVMRSTDNVQFTIPLELISYIEQDVSDHVDELEELQKELQEAMLASM